MKITIISDIHANFDALQAFPEDYDELWVLGGLVNYGPQPTEVVDQIMKTAEIVVRGNHDHRPEPCIVPLYIYIYRAFFYRRRPLTEEAIPVPRKLLNEA